MCLLLKNIWICDTFIRKAWQIVAVCKAIHIQLKIVQVNWVFLQVLLIIDALCIVLYFLEEFLKGVTQYLVLISFLIDEL